MSGLGQSGGGRVSELQRVGVGWIRKVGSVGSVLVGTKVADKS